MVTPVRPVRVDQELWDAADATLKAQEAPRRVVVVLPPGTNRSEALKAFLRALTK